MGRPSFAPIYDEASYEAAIRRRIAENRAKGGWTRFQAANPDAADIRKFVNNLYRGQTDGFIAACYKGFEEFGAPTPKMVDALRRMMAQQEAKKIEQKIIDSQSEFVGNIGNRQSFTLTLTFKTSFESDFGTVHITGFKDEKGNILVYKGSIFFQAMKGETVTFKATIKNHNIRDGIKQTILTRPKIG